MRFESFGQDLTSEGTAPLENVLQGHQGSMDLSKRLFENKKALPVPIVVSDPAVGYGGGLLGVWFHEPPISIPKSEKSKEEKGNKSQLIPPSVSGIGGLYTINDSWAAFAGHFHSWNNDSIRYTGLLGYTDLNLKYYAPGKHGSEGLNSYPIVEWMRSSSPIASIRTINHWCIPRI